MSRPQSASEGTSTTAAPTGRKKPAQGKERSDAALGHASQNTPSPEEAKESDNIRAVLNDGKNRNLWPLPKTWSWSTVGQLTEVIRGASPRPKGDPRYFGGDVPWIMIADVTRQPGKYLYKTREGVTEAGAALSRKIPAGELILSNSATVCVPKILKVDGCIHDGFVAFPTLKGRVNLDFAYYWFEFVRPTMIQENRQGVTQVNLNTGIVREMHFPLAPLPEQRRIVAEIEKQFTRLEAGVAALRRVQANLKRYRAAVLKAACEGRLVPTEAAWPQKQIATAIETMDQGWSPKCETEPSDSDTTWAVIKTTAIQNLRFLEDENKTLPTALKPRAHLELVPGDLLVTRAGPRSRVGVACLVKSTRPRLMLCDKAYRLRCKAAVAHPAFLELVLNAPHIQDEVNKLKTGISDSGVNLTQKRFGELTVPLPPLAEQTRIVAEVERRLSVVEELESVVSANLQRATRLRQSILQKAFTGEL